MRVLALVVAGSLAMGGPIPRVLVRALPGLSPLVAATSSIAQRRWYLAWFWAVPPAAVLLMAVWRGRFFCRWLCPAGTVYSLPARWSLKKPLLKIRLNAYLFWTILFSSLVGVPLAASLDPLSTFNRLTPLLTGTYTIASLVPGLLVPLFLVLGVFQPMIWCAHVCPLGYLLEFSRSVRRRPIQTLKRDRRGIVAGLLLGVPLAALTRKFLLAKDTYKAAPVLPPGAKDMESCAAACTRCYACVNACPTDLIRVGFGVDRAIGQVFQPEVRPFNDEDRPEFGYCPEWCNRCTQVCPAGALTPLAFAEKWHLQIGVAKITREACLAWEDGEECMVCQEVCPYLAIDSDWSEDDVARPVVNEEICRGCGSCLSKCPAIREGEAIVVVGVPHQQHVAAEDPAPEIDT